MKTLIIGDRQPDIANLISKLKDEGEIIMEEKKVEKMEIKPAATIKDYLRAWADGIKAKGQEAFWPSWA